jgi:ribosomal protein L7/L12
MESLLLMLLGIVLITVLSLSNAVGRQSARLAELQRQFEALAAHLGVEPAPPEEAPAPVLEHLRRGEKIRAIREYRAATGVGLKEAKDAVERLEAQHLIGG